jgi:hypothetical protein
MSYSIAGTSLVGTKNTSEPIVHWATILSFRSYRGQTDANRQWGRSPCGPVERDDTYGLAIQNGVSDRGTDHHSFSWCSRRRVSLSRKVYVAVECVQLKFKKSLTYYTRGNRSNIVLTTADDNGLSSLIINGKRGGSLYLPKLNY